MTKSTNWDRDQTSLDPKILPVITKALSNPHYKMVPRCPLPGCSWEGRTWNWEGRTERLGKLKRHLREKHRAYYQMAVTKPFIINEEEEFSHG